MGILTTEIQDFIKTQKLGFVATVCPDGTPNLSPKGTTTVWDDDYIIFADIHSPGTIRNLMLNKSIEINIVDIFIRKGYRFKGSAEILSSGSLFDDIVSFYRNSGTNYVIKHVLMVKVDRILAINSPVYDTGISEVDVAKKWIDYWSSFYPH